MDVRLATPGPPRPPATVDIVSGAGAAAGAAAAAFTPAPASRTAAATCAAVRTLRPGRCAPSLRSSATAAALHLADPAESSAPGSPQYLPVGMPTPGSGSRPPSRPLMPGTKLRGRPALTASGSAGDLAQAAVAGVGDDEVAA